MMKIYNIEIQMEAASIESTGQVVAQCSETYQMLSNCWNSLPSAQTRNRPFLELVTSAFPAHKVCFIDTCNIVSLA